MRQGCMGFVDTLVVVILPCSPVDRGQQWITASSSSTVSAVAHATAAGVSLRSVGADGMCLDQHALSNGTAQVRPDSQ